MYSQVHTDPLIGTLFAERYLINFLVARGGMGNIYQANDIKMGRILAIKMLRSEFSDDPLILRRFERESDAISNLKHPNICQFYESGCSPDGIHYFTMEYLKGHALDQLLKEQHVLQPETAISYVIQVAEGLCDAHDRGIIHRDLKPANIFIVHEANAQDHIKVLDFGVAKIHDDFKEIQEKLTRVGSTLGTPYYMSPEQIQGLEVDARTDVYALGVILWECVFGEPVFKGKTLLEIFKATSSSKLPKLPVNMRSNSLWQNLYEVLSKALQKDRDRRYSSMHAFQRALEEILETEGNVHHPLKTPRSLPIWKDLKGAGITLKTKLAEIAHDIPLLKLLIIGTSICLCIGGIVTAIVLMIPPHVEVTKPHFETYKFYSNVPATVLLNEDTLGKTPMSIDLTVQPPFNITFHAPDYPDEKLEITETSSDISVYAINFNPQKTEPPIIHLETLPPGADVAIEGYPHSEKTPCEIEVPSNRKKLSIKLRKEGYQTENLVIMPNGGDIQIKTNLFRY